MMTGCLVATRRARLAISTPTLATTLRDTSEATFTGVLGGSVGGDDAGGNVLLCGAERHHGHGWPGDGDLQLGCADQHADGDGSAWRLVHGCR